MSIREIRGLKKPSANVFGNCSMLVSLITARAASKNIICAWGSARSIRSSISSIELARVNNSVWIIAEKSGAGNERKYFVISPIRPITEVRFLSVLCV